MNSTKLPPLTQWHKNYIEAYKKNGGDAEQAEFYFKQVGEAMYLCGVSASEAAYSAVQYTHLQRYQGGHRHAAKH